LSWNWRSKLVACAIGANLGAIISTYYIIALVKANAGNAAYALEGNPINHFLLQLPVLQFAILGAFYCVIVWRYRELSKVAKAKPTPINIFALNTFVFIMFFLLILDMANDLGIVLKLVGV
jgi:hypothetical protein